MTTPHNWWGVVAAGMILAVSPTCEPAEPPPRALTLPQAIQLALEKNPDLATAEHRVEAARAALQQANASFWPQIRLSEGYTATDNPVQAFMMTLNQRAFSLSSNFNHPDTTDNFNTRALATYNLYNGGRDQAGRQAARLGTEARAQQAAATRNDLVFEVTRAFYTIVKARQFVDTATAAVTNMEANVNVASNRFANGAVLKSDWLDAEVRLAEARENLVRARNSTALADTIFRQVLGVGAEESVTAGETEPVPLPLPGGEGGKVPSSGGDTGVGGFDVSHRPELLAARNVVAVAEQQVRVATGRYHPRLNAFASYDLDSGNASRYSDSWTAGVSVEVDVFDGFLTRGKVAEARANLEAAREQLRRTSLALQTEVEQARLERDSAQARLATTTRSVAQAAESLQITKDRYGAGAALFTQVLEAETALTSARQRRTAAETDCRIAAAAVARAAGTIAEENQ